MNIDIVIIGLNVSRTLGACLDSVENSHYRRGELSVVYVDSGSTDDSVEIARSRPNVRVISLNSRYPSPGAGRNAGWRSAHAPLVQFLDADTEMDPQWLDHAVDAFERYDGAIRGCRHERNPGASVFNWIADQEWNAPPGECSDFGGDVLIRRSALEQSGGYDEILVGGEDPELSQRVRAAGWRIVQLGIPMTSHDLDMKTPGQYWKRSYRTGYGFAAVVDRTGFKRGSFWGRELMRIVIRGGSGPLLIAFGLLFALLFHPLFIGAAAVGCALLFYPRLVRVSAFAKTKSLVVAEARQYAWHCSLVVVPEFFGVTRFWIGRILGTPLRNRLPLASAAVCSLLTWGALALAVMSGAVSSCGSRTGVNDFTTIASQKGKAGGEPVNVGGVFEAQAVKEARLLATESELDLFSRSAPDDYYVGPGDVMEIIVRERPEISVKETTVSPDGKISAPQVGILNVQGKTTTQLTDEITERLSSLYEDPEVTIHVHDYNNNKVYILGRIENPGLVKFGGTGTLLEAIAMGGGLPTVAEDAFLSRAVIFRGKEKVIWVDLRELLQRGNVAMNPRLKNNDIVFIPESDDELVYVMGEVEGPGAVRLKTELSVLDAIMESGGPTRDAKSANTYLIRYEDGKGHVQRIDMDQFVERGDLRQNYLLRDGDIIFVSRRGLAEINYVIAALSPAISYLNLGSLAATGF